MRTEFDSFGRQGVIFDVPPWSLGDAAWSDSLNVRFRDGAAESFDGHSSVFGTPIGSPYRLHGIGDGQAYYWVYAGVNRIWATDGGVHADVSSLSLSYSATDAIGWNGGAFQRHMILNTGLLPPQVWVPNLSGRFGEIQNWESGLLCDVIRPFRNYLFGLRCTEAGLYNPRLLRHSNGATAGNLPTSWDYTDPNEDTGRVEFGQTTDALVDCLAMRDILMIYKESHCWAAQWTGSVDNPFEYRQVFSQVGLLSQYCAAAFEGRHLVLSTDDVLVHDGNQAVSVVDQKARSWLFSRINPEQYRRSYVVANHRDREIWICFAEAGNDWPNMALVWNWTHNTLQPRQLGQPTPHIAFGVVSPNSGETFDTIPETFDDRAGTFDEQAFNPSLTSLLMADPFGPALMQVDASGSFNGTQFVKRLTRSMLPFGDLLVQKRVMRIIPKIQGNPGIVVRIYVGTRQGLEDSVTWTQPVEFTVGTHYKADFRVTGRTIDVRFESDAIQPFRMHGFDVEWDPAGYY